MLLLLLQPPSAGFLNAKLKKTDVAEQESIEFSEICQEWRLALLTLGRSGKRGEG